MGTFIAVKNMFSVKFSVMDFSGENAVCRKTAVFGEKKLLKYLFELGFLFFCLFVCFSATAFNTIHKMQTQTVLSTHARKLIGSLSSGISRYPAMTFQTITCVVVSMEEYMISFPHSWRFYNAKQNRIGDVWKGSQIMKSAWTTSSMYENKGAQSSVLSKSSCIALEQVNRVPREDLRLEFQVIMKKKHTISHASVLPHCRWEMMRCVPLYEVFGGGCRESPKSLLLSGKRDEDPCQSSHLWSSADKDVLLGKWSGWEMLILSVFSVFGRTWAEHGKLRWLQTTFLENVFRSPASKLHQPSSLPRSCFSVLRNSQRSVGLLVNLWSDGAISRRNYKCSS